MDFALADSVIPLNDGKIGHAVVVVCPQCEREMG